MTLGDTRKWRMARQLSAKQQRYLMRALIELGVARLRHALLPPASILGSMQARQPDDELDANSHLDVRLVAWSIAVAAKRVPWRADCLICAMAANRWLRRYGRRPDFYLGVVKVGERFQAHAWLRCEGKAITGGHANGYSQLVAARSD
jgi:hypothetical protein